MNKIQFMWIWTGAILLLSACAPEPIFRLHSDHDEEEIRMVSGMEYLMSEKEHSTAIIAYYRHFEDRVVMDLEVINYSDAMIRFEPADLSYQAYQKKFVWDEKPEDGKMQDVLIAEGGALDPEQVIINIDMNRSRADAREQTSMIFDGITAGLEVIDDIATAGERSTGEQIERHTERVQDSHRRAERRNEYYRYASGLRQQRAYWEMEAIRTTDLLPDDFVAGEISFPIIEDADIVEIFVSVGDEVHQFNYIQRRFFP